LTVALLSNGEAPGFYYRQSEIVLTTLATSGMWCLIKIWILALGDKNAPWAIVKQ